MKTKEWNVEYKWHAIRFVNQWSFAWVSIEELFIDGKSVKKVEKDLTKVSVKDFVSAIIEYKMGDDLIRIRAWQKWHMCGVAVQVYINELMVWWDKILLFGPKIIKK